MFLLSAALIPALAGGPWLPTSNAASGSTSTLAELQQATSAMQAADEDLAEDRPEAAQAHLDAADEHLATAERALTREAAHLGSPSRDALEQALALAQDGHEAREAEAGWRAAIAADQAAVDEDEDVASQAQALASANATLAGAEEMVRAREELRERSTAFANQHPELAVRAGLGPSQAPPSEPLASTIEDERSRFLAQTLDLAFTPITDEHRETMSPEARELLAEHDPPRLREHFASFDRDENGTLDRSEAEAFFAWVEDDIDYRHDDEEATAEIPGTPVGDGRPGTDHQQTPVETFDEGMGDCEDTSVLQIAFHRYWGARAYLALLNTEAGEGVSHAAAIVHLDDLDGRATEDRTYTFAEDNEHGIPPGTYAIVDNTYSDTYGQITGDVEPGTFEIQEVETLTEAIAYSKGWRLAG